MLILSWKAKKKCIKITLDTEPTKVTLTKEKRMENFLRCARAFYTYFSINVKKLFAEKCPFKKISCTHTI